MDKIFHELSGTPVIRGFHEKGYEVMMDDFGTGYSSLSLLHQLPFNGIKIDLSFIADLTCDSEVAKYVRAILALAETLDINVIAEGVETQAALEYLRDIHCPQAQGYFFGKPVKMEEVVKLISR